MFLCVYRWFNKEISAMNKEGQFLIPLLDNLDTEPQRYSIIFDVSMVLTDISLILQNSPGASCLRSIVLFDYTHITWSLEPYNAIPMA